MLLTYFLDFLDFFLAFTGFSFFSGFLGGFLLSFHDFNNDFLFFDQKGSGDSSFQSVSGNAATVGSGDGFGSSGGSAWLESGGSGSFDSLQFFAGVTAFGNYALFTGVEKNEFSTWGFADFSLVRAGVPC